MPVPAPGQAEPDWEAVLKFLEPRPPHYCPHEPTLRQKVFLRSEAMEVLFGGHAGGGKGQSLLYGQVLTPWGFVAMGDIKVGSQVNNPDGTVATVIQVHPLGQKPLYRFTFSDGATCEVTDEHLWNVQIPSKRALKADRRDHDGNPVDHRIRDTIWLYEWMQDQAKREANGERVYKPQIPLTSPASFSVGKGRGRGRVVDPYLLGLLIGDGTITGGRTRISITSADPEITEACHEAAAFYGGYITRSGIGHIFSMCPALKEDLEYLGLLGKRANNKSIPRLYKMAPIADRWALIQGLMDTDGYVDDRGHCSYTTVSEDLAKDVQWVARSLGFNASITSKVGAYRNTAGERVECQVAYTVWLRGANEADLFRLTRKRERCTAVADNRFTAKKQIESIEFVGYDECQCITVDHPNGLYITDDFIVTHNSDALLMAALQYVDVPGYAGIIFRNTFSDLALPGSLMDRSHDWLDDVPDVRWNPNRHNWQFPSGATLTFGYLDKPNDHLRYKSAEFQFVGFDEVTEIREKHYRYLFSRIRRPSGRLGLHLAKVPLRMRAASNPAPNWVRRWFIEEGPKKGRIFVESSLSDNPFVDHVSYRRALAQLDEVERARLERGDWYAEESGSKFKREWFTPYVTSDELPMVGKGVETRFGGRFEKVVRYWDLAASVPTERNPDPDWTAGALVGLAEGRLYVLDMVRFRKDPGGVEKEVRETADLDGPEVMIRMEKEGGASGVNTIDHYARFVLLGYDFDGHPTVRNKEARADLWASKAKRKEVKFRSGGSWITDLLDEMSGFPETSPHDDQIDAISGANEVLLGLGVPQRRAVEIIV